MGQAFRILLHHTERETETDRQTQRERQTETDRQRERERDGRVKTKKVKGKVAHCIVFMNN